MKVRLRPFVAKTWSWPRVVEIESCPIGPLTAAFNYAAITAGEEELGGFRVWLSDRVRVSLLQPKDSSHDTATVHRKDYCSEQYASRSLVDAKASAVSTAMRNANRAIRSACQDQPSTRSRTCGGTAYVGAGSAYWIEIGSTRN